MKYFIRIDRNSEGRYTASSSDLGFCSTESFATKEDAARFMCGALPAAMYLQYRAHRKAIPLPSATGEDLVAVNVPVKVQAKILLWNLMVKKGVKTGQLAKLLGITQSTASLMTDMSKDKTSIEAIENAVDALGGSFDLDLQEA